MAKRCAATAKSGKRCGGFAIVGSDFCINHDPKRRKQAQAARRSGGERSRGAKRTAIVPKLIRSLEDLADAVGRVTRAVANSAINHHEATAFFAGGKMLRQLLLDTKRRRGTVATIALEQVADEDLNAELLKRADEYRDRVNAQ